MIVLKNWMTLALQHKRTFLISAGKQGYLVVAEDGDEVEVDGLDFEGVDVGVSVSSPSTTLVPYLNTLDIALVPFSSSFKLRR